MGGGASIDVAATGGTDDKVRLNDVADAHYRRELSKVITYLRSRLFTHIHSHSLTRCLPVNIVRFNRMDSMVQNWRLPLSQFYEQVSTHSQARHTQLTYVLPLL